MDQAYNDRNVEECSRNSSSTSCVCLLRLHFFYYYSFGRGLIYFASPTEVFSVSLAEVAPLYLFGGVGMAIGIWSYESDEEITERYSEKSARVVKKVKTWHRFGIILFALVLFVIGVLASVLSGYIFWHLFLIPAALVFAWLSGAYISTKGLAPSILWLVYGVGSALIAICLNGLSDGQSAAKNDFSFFVDRPQCDDLVILKDVSQRYLALNKGNDRFIVNEECKQMFMIIDGGEGIFYKDINPARFIVSMFE